MLHVVVNTGSDGEGKGGSYLTWGVSEISSEEMALDLEAAESSAVGRAL